MKKILVLNPENIKKIFILLIFSLQLLIASETIKKYDKYEVSTDNKSNHTLIKSDILRFWNEAELIKDQYENNDPISKMAGIFYSSYLPSKIVAAYYILIGEDIFLTNRTLDNKYVVKSNNKKIFLLYFQILLFFLSIIILYNVLKKKNPEISFLVVSFLILEPTINQFHFSFFSESIFFSLQIIIFALVLKRKKNLSNALLIGIFIGILYLQRMVSVLYFFPVLLFFIITKKNLRYLISYFFGFVIVISFLCLHNYKTSGVPHITPTQGKTNLYLYLIPDVFMTSSKTNYQINIENLNNKIKSFKTKNNINLNLKKDSLKLNNYIQYLSLKIIFQEPVSTIKVVSKKILHTSLLNPFNIYAFYNYEYNPLNRSGEYYKSSLHKKHVKARIFYSLLIFLCSFIGLIQLFKMKQNVVFYLLLSILYFLLLGGWIGNPRYFAPNIIYLSFFFSYGLVFIKKIILNKNL